MFHQIGLRTTYPDRLIAFYEAALEPLGYAKLGALIRLEREGNRIEAVGLTHSS